MNRKKIHFYELAFFFCAIVILTQFFMWGDVRNINPSESMMARTMGENMREMHLKNIKYQDLFNSEKESVKSEAASSEHGNSSNGDKIIKKVHYIATITIISLLPLIISGSAFLAIMWIK